ncbi:MAG: aminotransferase class V-fold PLP-dependent enzyme [Candidatus Omnitrophica bacterium]|nr:aminotransferase class V-fold PLP-dependent enzyme [Candidatus Omnitrophota bacterium]
MITFDDIRVERLLIKEYQHQLARELNAFSNATKINQARHAFELKFASYIGTARAMAVGSGSDALHIALLTLHIRKGDSVIVPNITFPAVPLSILYAGATPIIIDINASLQINENKIAEHVQQNTKAVITPHMFGRPCNINKIVSIAQKLKIKIVEDCCQSLGSSINNKKLGSYGDIGCFSFALHKILGSCGGNGGMLCFNNQKYTKAKEFLKGWEGSQTPLTAGQHFSTTSFLDLMAVTVKWRYLTSIIKSRQQVKSIYEEELSGCRHIELLTHPSNEEIVPQGFIVLSNQKEKIMKLLIRNGISCQPAYTPLHQMPAFRKFAKGNYPNSIRYISQAINLPIYSFMDRKDAKFIATIIKKADQLK